MTTMNTPLSGPAEEHARRAFHRIWPGLEADETIIALLANEFETFAVGVLVGVQAAEEIIAKAERSRSR